MTISSPPATPSVATSSGPAPVQCAQVYGGTGATAIPITLPGLDGYLYSRPCQSAHGGDIHYLSICGSGLLSRFCLADVVGHGEQVALVSSETHDLLRQSVNWTDHRETLRLLNRALSDKGLQSLTTAAVFTYFPATRSLTYSYAGHPRAWHWSAARRRWSELALDDLDDRSDSMQDLPLAVANDTTFSRARLRPGGDDVIVITTDGVTDAADAEGRHLLGAGLGTMLESIDDHAPQAIVESLVERLAEFCGVDEFTHDDVTILALRILPFSKLAAVGKIVANRIVRPIARRGHHT